MWTLSRLNPKPTTSAAARRFILSALTLGLVVATYSGLRAEDVLSLFDGKTLQGWEGNERIFRIEEGAIVAGSLKHKIDRNEFLCTTDTYENFELRLEVKLIGEGANAGVQFRTKRIPNHHEVSGYQADMGETWWGKLYDESRRNRVLAGPPDTIDMNKIVNANEWNTYVIRCEGPRVRLWLNDTLTVDYTEVDANIDRSGVIAVQIHSGPPSEAWYRNIRLERLNASAK